MITVEPGKAQDPTDWWIGKIAHCKTCNYKGKLEASDREKISMSITADRKKVEIHCPNCHIMSATYTEGREASR